MSLLKYSVLLWGVISASALAQIEMHRLGSPALELQVTPDIGGRIVSLALRGRDNILLVGEEVITEPEPYVAPDADNVGYLAQEIWVGPQSHWWTQQQVNPERAASKATWPPDPYLILARNQLVESSPTQVTLRSPASPVSGLVLTKRYSLVADNPNQVQLEVEAQNFRDTQVAWDIWFNTRVSPEMQVYVPLADAADVRLEPFGDKRFDDPVYQLQDGLLRLAPVAPGPDKIGRGGKLFIQPQQGWLAAFNGDQVFIIHFPLQPKAAIHPEQGQVELYLFTHQGLPKQGLLELEVHAPYRQLAPGQRMSAGQRWTLLPYPGDASAQAQRDFLRSLELH